MEHRISERTLKKIYPTGISSRLNQSAIQKGPQCKQSRSYFKYPEKEEKENNCTHGTN